MATKITIKQEAFARAYVETGNASEAYRRAYDVAKDCKPNTVEKRACELLKNGKVAGRVAQLQQAAAKRHDVTMDKIVRELALMGFANMLDYVQTQEDGSAYVDLSKLTRDQAAAIVEVTSETYMEGSGDDAKAVKRTKFKLADKKSNLELLGRHLGMFEKDNAQKADAAARAAAEAAEVSSRELARAVLGLLREAQVDK